MPCGCQKATPRNTTTNRPAARGNRGNQDQATVDTQAADYFWNGTEQQPVTPQDIAGMKAEATEPTP